MQTTKDAQSRTGVVIEAACAYHARQREWRRLEDIGAPRDLTGPAEQKLIDTFCELVPALGTISYLPRMIRGAVKRIFALAEIQLRLVVVTRKRPGGLQYTVARPDGEIVYRELARQEYDQLDAALDVLERELRSMAGLPVAAPEQTREPSVVNFYVDASVPVDSSKLGAAVESKTKQHIKLDQAAGRAKRSKRTLENYRDKKYIARTGATALPEPDIKATRSGQPDLWEWTVMRPWLETTFGLVASKLPEYLPDPFRAGADRQNLKNLAG